MYFARFQIDVVEEKRMYSEWGSQIDEKCGIIAGKKALNELHFYLGRNGYYQVRNSPDFVLKFRSH